MEICNRAVSKIPRLDSVSLDANCSPNQIASTIFSAFGCKPSNAKICTQQIRKIGKFFHAIFVETKMCEIVDQFSHLCVKIFSFG